MKKKILLVLLLILALSMTMLMTSCGGSSDESAAAPEETAETETAEEPAEEPQETPAEEPAAAQTLEEFANTNAEMKNLLGYNEQAGVTIDVKGNDLIYFYDFSLNSEYTKEQIMTDAVKENIEASLDDEETIANFVNTVTTLEDQTGISGIQLYVIYGYGDEIIVSHIYDKNGLVD